MWIKFLIKFCTQGGLDVLQLSMVVFLNRIENKSYPLITSTHYGSMISYSHDLNTAVKTCHGLSDDQQRLFYFGAKYFRMIMFRWSCVLANDTSQRYPKKQNIVKRGIFMAWKRISNIFLVQFSFCDHISISSCGFEMLKSNC